MREARPTSINDMQVGGAHYKTSFQHWDWVRKMRLGYLEGCATKYVVRWRKKGGFEDLKKALHYLNKLIEYDEARQLPYERTYLRDQTISFAHAQNSTELERDFLTEIATWSTPADLRRAREWLLELMNEADSIKPIPVPLTEENHYAERAK